MKKLFLFITKISIVIGSFSAYGENATFDYETGKLQIPVVEVMSSGNPLGFYQVDMRQENDPNNPFSIIFKVDPTSLKASLEPPEVYPDANLPKESILKRVRERRSLLCGGRTDLPGFGYFCPDGRNCGFDIDLCRAVAAAVLNSSKGPITFIPVSTGKREQMLRENKVDILSRNTSWTSSRDIEWGHFTWIMFYDGQGFMVRRDSNISTITELDGKSICVVKETTSYINLVNYFAQRQFTFTPVFASETSELFPKYLPGECDAITTDRSGLAARRVGLDDQENHKILDMSISKKTLAPIVPSGDEQWLDIVKIVLFGLINAEELGITQDNVDAILTNAPEMENLHNNLIVRRLLGMESSFGQEGLNLEKDAIAQAIRAVGNYGEIYERYFGPNGVNIPRGLNKLWIDGGLIYAPPMQ